MNGFKVNIEEETTTNTNFRKVLFTGTKSQLVVMSLKPGEDIGLESHDVDQFFKFEQGVGKVTIDNEEFEVKKSDAVVVLAGAKHNVLNTGSDYLKLYTIYSPPQHPEGTIHTTKEEA